MWGGAACAAARPTRPEGDDDGTTREAWRGAKPGAGLQSKPASTRQCSAAVRHATRPEPAGLAGRGAEEGGGLTVKLTYAGSSDGSAGGGAELLVGGASKKAPAAAGSVSSGGSVADPNGLAAPWVLSIIFYCVE